MRPKAASKAKPKAAGKAKPKAKAKAGDDADEYAPAVFDPYSMSMLFADEDATAGDDPDEDATADDDDGAVEAVEAVEGVEAVEAVEAVGPGRAPLKMTRKCVTSRAYVDAKKLALAQGMTEARQIQACKKAYKAAGDKWDQEHA